MIRGYSVRIRYIKAVLYEPHEGRLAHQARNSCQPF
jgi:hypothetical protein